MTHESDAERVLREDYGWYEGIAKAAVESKGHCTYCGEDLLGSAVAYSAMQMDHLLPKSQYPKLALNTVNHVLCCFSCNGMKGAFDPAEEGEIFGEESVVALKSELIGRVKVHLVQKIKDREREWQDVISHIRC